MRSIAKLLPKLGMLNSKARFSNTAKLGYENITCWSVESSPTTIEIVVSQQQLTIAEKIVDNQLGISSVDY